MTAGGRTLTRRLTVRMDPRISTSMAFLRQQFALSQRLADALRRDTGLIDEVRKLRKDRPQDESLAALEGAAEAGRPRATQQPPALVPWNACIAGVYDLLQST